jgi:pseudouridine synthase
MMHKPAGVLTATTDRDRKTVLDLLPPDLQRLKLVPAGRLDKDTTGLLLLTNDGDFVHRVISPRHHVPKVYYAETDGLPTETDEDVLGIADLAEKVRKCYFSVPKERRAPGLRITVSASVFVPKNDTPFQWAPQLDYDTVVRRQQLLHLVRDAVIQHPLAGLVRVQGLEAPLAGRAQVVARR